MFYGWHLQRKLCIELQTAEHSAHKSLDTAEEVARKQATSTSLGLQRNSSMVLVLQSGQIP
jgi:hypothetical protein